MKVAKDYNLQEFFEDTENDAKLKATVEAEFMFGEKRWGEEAEETCNIRWLKFMNVVLPEKFNNKVVDMIDFEHNEYEILHRNMPMMYKKLDKEQIRALELKKQKESKSKVSNGNKKGTTVSIVEPKSLGPEDNAIS